MHVGLLGVKPVRPQLGELALLQSAVAPDLQPARDAVRRLVSRDGGQIELIRRVRAVVLGIEFFFLVKLRVLL